MIRKFLRAITLIIFVVSTLALITKCISYYEEDSYYKNLGEDFIETISDTEATGNEWSTGSEGPTQAAVAPKVLKKLNKLKARNEDFIAWITIADTKINYPITHTDNNDYYLSHNFDKEYNCFGCIYLDSNNSSLDDNVCVLYGHRMIDGSMFAGLKYYVDDDYLSKHNKITITSLEGCDTYKVIKCMEVADTDLVYSLDQQHVEGLVGYTGDFLILSTCVGYNSSKRLIVIAERNGEE